MHLVEEVSCVQPETWGWRVGFGVAALLSLLSAVSFYSGSALYIKLKAKKDLLSGMAQVVVACYRKRHVSLLSAAHTSGIRYHHKKGSLLIFPSDKLRILNKACIVEAHERGVITTEEAQGSWNLCTVEQVERYRRNMSAPEAHSIGTKCVLPVSTLWLAPQYSLMGIAMALTAVTQTEFYYSELHKSMASIASTLFAVGLSAGSLVSSFLVRIIDNVTGSGGSWVSNDINDGHYDYYYWILAGLNALNYGYFLACCRAYGPVKQPEEIILLAEADSKDGEQNL